MKNCWLSSRSREGKRSPDNSVMAREETLVLRELTVIRLNGRNMGGGNGDRERMADEPFS